MSTHKTKIPKLSEQQYNEYVAALRDDAALFNPDGTIFVPDDNFDTNEEVRKSED